MALSEWYVIPIDRKGKIRIVKVPAGEAPFEIRQQWVGLEIPVLLFETNASHLGGALSKIPTPPRSVYIVSQAEALKALEEKNPETAKWWKSQGFPVPDEGFAFNENEVEEIEPVSPRL